MYGTPGNPGGVASGAAMHNASYAFGPCIRVEPITFETILARTECPLVVTAPAGIFGSSNQYITSYKGLTFCTKSKEPVQVPPGAEVVEAKRMAVPV